MPNDRVAKADAIAAAYWAAVARMGEKAGAADTMAMEQAEAETRHTLATEHAREAEQAASAEDDETKSQAKAALQPRLRPRL